MVVYGVKVLITQILKKWEPPCEIGMNFQILGSVRYFFNMILVTLRLYCISWFFYMLHTSQTSAHTCVYYCTVVNATWNCLLPVLKNALTSLFFYQYWLIDGQWNKKSRHTDYLLIRLDTAGTKHNDNVIIYVKTTSGRCFDVKMALWLRSKSIEEDWMLLQRLNKIEECIF